MRARLCELRSVEKPAKLSRVRPDDGGRIELTLAKQSEAGARYTLTVSTLETAATTRAEVDAASGRVEFANWLGQPPPEWLTRLAGSLLRSAWRSKTSDGAWPRRVTRWRPTPKA